ncbi:hypothetical protein KGM_213162 [Danaus plexippus plexippus]|uniref:Uncharacterized protein n=1 Tax=Danaus plexippus plexippus TaxID=278856 RepID=A0A212F326_DANPL|nr:hypothetical protein KGM_213162 [Danaus plexippus plexippus]
MANVQKPFSYQLTALQPDTNIQKNPPIFNIHHLVSLASQNSRRRSVEHLRRLTRELRALRACRDDALSERRLLLDTRAELRDRFNTLRSHVVQYLQERSDYTEVPNIDHTRINVDEDKTEQNRQTNRQIYECRLDKLVQQSVNHVYREKICAKTVFIGDEVLDLCVKKRSHGRKQPTPKKTLRYLNYGHHVDSAPQTVCVHLQKHF